MRLKDLAGEKFGRLEVESRAQNVGVKVCWNCKCECGGSVTATGSNLKSGDIRSCGCLRSETTVSLNTTHGMTESGTYNSWRGMRHRCLNPKAKYFKEYGGRGITICKQWVDSFENFHRDMGDRPEGKTLDRIKVDGNYELGNCKWSTAIEQRSNRRDVERTA